MIEHLQYIKLVNSEKYIIKSMSIHYIRLPLGVFLDTMYKCSHIVDLYLFLWESVCSGFLTYPSLIHRSSIAALTLGLLAGSGSRRDNTNDTAPAMGAQMDRECKGSKGWSNVPFFFVIIGTLNSVISPFGLVYTLTALLKKSFKSRIDLQAAWLLESFW